MRRFPTILSLVCLIACVALRVRFDLQSVPVPIANDAEHRIAPLEVPDRRVDGRSSRNDDIYQNDDLPRDLSNKSD